MQTFVPFDDVHTSIECLDYKRLGKQRVEASQIIKALTIEDYGWKNHPATKMWDGYVPALKWYHDICIAEWISRGFNNTMKMFAPILENIEMPDWWGDNRVHSSHRAALLWKEPDHYIQFGWKESPRVDYHWPTQEK